MADHQHVEMLVYRVDRVRSGRVGRGRQDVGLTGHLDDVGGMSTTGALGVIGVDGALGHRGQRVLDEAGLVQGIGVDCDLDIEVFRHGQAVVDRRRCGAPVLVQLEPDSAGRDLLRQRPGPRGVALAEESQVHRQRVGRLQHALDIPRPWRAGRRIGPGGRAGAAAEHRGDARHQGIVDLLRTDEMDVRINAAGGQDLALTGNSLGARADHDVDAGLYVRVAGLADADDAAVLDPDVGLDHAPVIEDEGIRDHHVGDPQRRLLALPHAVADHLASAEFNLVAVHGAVFLDLDDQFGVRQPHPVTRRGPVHLRVGLPAYRCHRPLLPSSGPMTWPLNP